MTNMRCMRAELLLDRRTAGLSAADSLRLEGHLASCEHCSEQAKLIAGLRTLSDAFDATLLPSARERAIAGALSSVQREPSAPSRLSVLRPQPLLLAVALAAGFGVVLGLGLRPGSVDRGAVKPNASPLASGSAPSPLAAQQDRVLSGRIELDGRSWTEGAPLAEASALRAPEGATLALAQASVALRPQTSVRWQRAERRLRLDAGSVLADVDPGVHQSFVVETSRFSVLVLGTRFEVSLDEVRVQRGRVRVLAPDGRVLVAALGPGERFALDAIPQGRAATVVGREERAASGAPERAPQVIGMVAKKPEAAPVQSHAAVVRGDAAELLGEARTQLGARQVARAQQQIDAALALSPSRSLRAEAMSLRAECALVEGDRGAAIDAYLHVAQEFGELPAGENALFAAARLELDRGHGMAAGHVLERYLARYPHGRFIKEATARLRELSAAPNRDP
jgi:ferric-dicitrate binding protein FerR (iron transport regulator)